MDKLTKEVLKKYYILQSWSFICAGGPQPLFEMKEKPWIIFYTNHFFRFLPLHLKKKIDSFSSGSWKHLQELSLSEWFSSKNVNLPWRWKQLLIYVSFQRWEKCLGSWFGSVMSSQWMRYGQQQDKLHTGYACNSCFHTNVCEMLKQLAKQVLCWSCTVIQKHATLPLWQASIHCLWLSCCCFHLLTLCYNSTNSCLWNI